MLNVGSPAAQRMLHQLDLAKRAHADWTETTIGRLVCHMKPAPGGSLDPGPHRCRFGQWYYEGAPVALRQQPEFEMIGEEHQRVHALAQRMLRAASVGMPVDAADYHQFTSSNRKLVLEIDVLRHELQHSLDHQDPLTGALERHALEAELHEWHELSKRGAQQCCVAFMDLDRFKEVNDTHGHLIGDRVLERSVQRMKDSLRPYDKLFRYGGDEFVFLLPAIELESARSVVARVRQQLASTPLVITAEGTVVTITGSFGLAELDPRVSVQETLDRADTALLTAKSMGRNRIVAWDPSVHSARGLPALELADNSRPSGRCTPRNN